MKRQGKRTSIKPESFKADSPRDPKEIVKDILEYPLDKAYSTSYTDIIDQSYWSLKKFLPGIIFASEILPERTSAVFKNINQ